MALNAYEQLFLELVNRARLDPLAEAARMGISLNDGLPAGTLDGSARQVLAPNALLETAATNHSLWMLAADTFSHTGSGGSSVEGRVRAAGYALTGSWSVGENIALTGTTGTVNPALAIGQLYGQLFTSAGHRKNVLNGGFRETGIGNEIGVYTSDGRDYNTSMITQVFATSGTRAFVTGVVYDDLDGDLFYDIGEGRGGATLTAGGSTTTAASAGGYAIGVTPGKAVAVDISWNGVLRSLTADLTQGNVKLDFLADGTLLTSGSVVMGSGFTDAIVLGVAGLSLTGNDLGNRLTGGTGDDTLNGNRGADTLIGGLGNDTYVVDNRDDQAIEAAGAGHDKVDSRISYALPDNVEDLVLLSTGRGRVGTGNALNNVITGNHKADVLYGGAGHDTLFGVENRNRLYGGDGNDQLFGGTGIDKLYGDAGSDTLSGADGDDHYFIDINDVLVEQANGGFDTVHVDFNATLALNFEALILGTGATTGTGNAAANRIEGAGNDNTLSGLAGDDTLKGNGGRDQVFGGTGNDVLFGGTSNDTIRGGDDDDKLYGDEANDLLFGEAGNDRLYGGTGDDTLSGGAGNDTLSGGVGADVFEFVQGAGEDRIVDFNAGEGDRLRLGSALWGGGLTVAQMLDQFASQSGTSLLLTFDSESLRIDGMSAETLAAQIDLF